MEYKFPQNLFNLAFLFPPCCVIPCSYLQSKSPFLLVVHMIQRKISLSLCVVVLEFNPILFFKNSPVRAEVV